MDLNFLFQQNGKFYKKEEIKFHSSFIANIRFDSRKKSVIHPIMAFC